MDAGASLYAETNKTGTTPLHVASARGHIEAMTVMMDQVVQFTRGSPPRNPASSYGKAS